MLQLLIQSRARNRMICRISMANHKNFFGKVQNSIWNQSGVFLKCQEFIFWVDLDLNRTSNAKAKPSWKCNWEENRESFSRGFFFLENRWGIRYGCFKYLMNKGGKHEPGSWQDSQVKCLLALIWSKPLGLSQKGFCCWLFWDQAVMWEFSCVKTFLNWLQLLDIHVFALTANLFLTGFPWSFVLW